jgi:hypothetical protein
VPTGELTTSIEPDLSTLELPKVTKEIEGVTLVPRSPSSLLETTIVDLADPTKSEANFNVAGTIISTNTSQEDLVFIDPQISDSSLGLMSLKPIFHIVRDVFFLGVYLLQWALKPSFAAWSQILALETKLPEGMSRVRWKCVSTSYLHKFSV